MAILKATAAPPSAFYIVGVALGALLAFSLPFVAERRLRDIGWSSWFALVPLYPVIGFPLTVALMLISPQMNKRQRTLRLAFGTLLTLLFVAQLVGVVMSKS